MSRYSPISRSAAPRLMMKKDDVRDLSVTVRHTTTKAFPTRAKRPSTQILTWEMRDDIILTKYPDTDLSNEDNIVLTDYPDTDLSNER